MSDALLRTVERSTDQKWLEGCRDHNVRLGRHDIVAAVSHRLRYLALQDALMLKASANTVEDRVLESLRVYRELLKFKHGRNQAAGYTERELKQYGARETLIRTIRRAKKTDGLKLLAQHDRLDCAYEQIAIDYQNELPADVVEIARRTLADFNAISKD